MPLNPKASLGENISELMNSYKQKGTIGTSTPKSKKAAQKQAIAIAEKTKRGY
jgi:hypothetical protein